MLCIQEFLYEMKEHCLLSHHISSLDSEGACLLIYKLQYQIMLVECGGEKRAGKVLICLLTMSYSSL
jgi:hypothetical protein